jgi:hypothetical protein
VPASIYGRSDVTLPVTAEGRVRRREALASPATGPFFAIPALSISLSRQAFEPYG